MISFYKVQNQKEQSPINNDRGEHSGHSGHLCLTGNHGKSPLYEQSYIPDIESWLHICDHTVKINEPVHFKGFLKPVLFLIKHFS